MCNKRFELFLLLCTFLFVDCGSGTERNAVENDTIGNRNLELQASIKPKPNLGNVRVSETGIFHLNYTCVGMGSNFGSLEPVFEVNGNQFIYEKRQTSFNSDEPTRANEILLSGQLRKTAIDSIIAIVSGIDDTLIYRTDAGVMSGGVHYITISFKKRKLQFRLHNASDSRAHQIVDILNSHIPSGLDKLWLWDI